MKESFLFLFFLAFYACGNDPKKDEKIQYPFSLSEESQASYQSYSTFFDRVGSPIGGCGVPDHLIDSPSYVALNVQNTPGDYYSKLARPIQNPEQIGAFNNGLNCGRFIRVHLSDLCVGGRHDGGRNGGICNGGRLEADEHNGAVQDFVVADSCQDSSGWCRDDRYHLDLSRSSLGKFINHGDIDSSLGQRGWSNRKLSWRYIPAPNYQGDIRIFFVRNAQFYWPTIMLSHLENGVHKVEYKVGDTWLSARPMSDLGQQFQLGDKAAQFEIRVYDADDKLVKGGQSYKFGFPCPNNHCSDFREATYTVVPAGT